MPAWRKIWKVSLLVVSLALFVIALKLMQVGVRAIAPLLEEYFDLETPMGALGFGWGAAYVLLSGSPVAAMAITLFDAREIGEVAAFAMITGSRLGAAFIVLLLGFFYVFYHREPMHDLRVGLLALVVTGSIYLPAFAVGYAALEFGWVRPADGGTNTLAEALEEGPVEEITDKAEKHLPAWGIFLAGLVLIIGTFKLFDLSLPSLDADDGKMERLRRSLDRPWAIFGVGAGITLISMSVTVSLSLLVPWHSRRLVRAHQLIPYIMGANIATFIDTLLAATTMKRAGSVAIVLVEMGAVAIISLLILAFAYGRYERMMMATVDWITARRSHLALFAAILAGVPATLLLLPRLVRSLGCAWP